MKLTFYTSMLSRVIESSDKAWIELVVEKVSGMSSKSFDIKIIIIIAF